MEEEKRCKRSGGNKKYKESENTVTSCKFHNGKPIFHEIKKGWDCCQQICYDWDEFQKLEGCCTGKHSDEKQETDFWKSNTVATAQTAIEKEEKRLKTAADFNAEQEAKLKDKKEEEVEMVPQMKDGKYS